MFFKLACRRKLAPIKILPPKRKRFSASQILVICGFQIVAKNQFLKATKLFLFSHNIYVDFIR